MWWVFIGEGSVIINYLFNVNLIRASVAFGPFEKLKDDDILGFELLGMHE